ncbi:MAG: flagellar basal body-associated protein FliL [Limisphaerales bacterium]
MWKFALFMGLFGAVFACSAKDENPLKDAVILVIRHAEKNENDNQLSPEGQSRAQAYAKYFLSFPLDGKPLKLDSLFAAADSRSSSRPRLTLEPLSQATKLPLNCRYKDKEPEKLAAKLTSKAHGKNILICWRRGEIPQLLRALGADPSALLPDGDWPENVFNWVIELRYDGEGRLLPTQCKRVNEHLLPGDGVQ